MFIHVPLLLKLFTALETMYIPVHMTGVRKCNDGGWCQEVWIVDSGVKK
jgi:hypothetical protein